MAQITLYNCIDSDVKGIHAVLLLLGCPEHLMTAWQDDEILRITVGGTVVSSMVMIYYKDNTYESWALPSFTKFAPVSSRRPLRESL